MNPRQRNAAAYRPHAGDRVLDRRTGRTGIYMDTIGGEHYLRPESGGREWTADPTHVTPAPAPSPTPADDGPDSDPTGRPRRPARGRCRHLGGERAG
ncbi:hypothetical protein ACFV4F_28785 [Kitasatospora sp. NPDC059722]|uniref:hypothetical protein n=1 Tax=Kitasatospora sp. NPDC059722 TaxID=3346925 RepID=UPI0036A57B51